MPNNEKRNYVARPPDRLQGLPSVLWPAFRLVLRSIFQAISTFWPYIELSSSIVTAFIYAVCAPFILPPLLIGGFFVLLVSTFVGLLTTGVAFGILCIKTIPFAVKALPIVLETVRDSMRWDLLHTFNVFRKQGASTATQSRESDEQPSSPGRRNPEDLPDTRRDMTYTQTHAASGFAVSNTSLTSASFVTLGDGALKTDFESVGGWKVDDSLHEQSNSLYDDNGLQISTSRRHRRTHTGSSLKMSGSNSPEIVRTPAQTKSSGSGRSSTHKAKHRYNGSDGSSPESYFHMTASTIAEHDDAGANLSKHSRSGSSSTASLGSAGRIPGHDVA